MATVRIRAHAKVNLYLRVLGRRDDGYHEVETVLHSIDLADYLELGDGIEGLKLVVQNAGPTGGFGSPPSDQNIVFQAAQLLGQSLERPLDADVRLGKRIPVGAGLGGGSADAAATLIGLRRLHALEVPDETLLRVAALLGADVPFFLQGGTALATGIGTDVKGLADPQQLWFVLGISRRPLLTKDVYAVWDETEQPPSPPVETMIEALASGRASEVGAALHNELQPAALILRPELQEGLDNMQSAGAIRVLLSGSGPTIFGLCEGADHARAVASKVRSHFDHTQVTCSQPRTIEILD